MSVDISLLKTGFVKTQADVILAQSNLAQSSRNQSDFIFSISTKVDAKVSDQSSLLDSLDKCMGIMASDLNEFVTWIRVVLPESSLS